MWFVSEGMDFLWIWMFYIYNLHYGYIFSFVIII